MPIPIPDLPRFDADSHVMIREALRDGPVMANQQLIIDLAVQAANEATASVERVMRLADTQQDQICILALAMKLLQTQSTAMIEGLRDLMAELAAKDD